ncbi:MBL fold metallo-hydrolase [Williamsia maris]|uniref:L-ascorbate metabolism protein UlaG, beta-lactamase superfamily n=1 Tax=Williamsia maris TaxID=72806 RepID=A0ABT1HJI5_9NOCA|nr:MBL fold metallo-hydrolase [Williamsia maris]MCP2178089.1 L-ascorbate metabolism protein UlaG, beta-lactamase superfamily [Williamsia maris]
MHLTHYGQSCVLLEHNGTAVLFDPGVLSHGFEQLTGLDAILVTHQDVDHTDLARIGALMTLNPQAMLVADEQSQVILGASWRGVASGDMLRVGGLTVRAVGRYHAVVVPGVTPVANVGYIVGDEVHHGLLYHPGDALYVPDTPIRVLLAPAGGSWLRLPDGIEFIRDVGAYIVVPIHTETERFPELYVDRYAEFCPPGTIFTTLPPRTRVALE